MTVAKVRSVAPIGWDQKLIEAQKSAIKRDLDANCDPDQSGSRLALIFQRLDMLASDDCDLGRLQRYIYAMSALVYHERQGGLSERQVDQLVELTYAILQAQGIRPRTSRLASLYGDIHQIKSQIYRKQGLPWRAAWEQQLALQLAGNMPSGGLGFQLLAMANRALRLGHAQLARRRFAEAETAGLGEVGLGRCRLGCIHAQWLVGSHDHATQLARILLDDMVVPEDIRREVGWLELVWEFQRSFDLSPLLKAVRHDGPYYEATYIIEVCLWGYVIESRAFIERLPRLASIRRNKNLRPQRLGAWYECAVLLQECYDHALPLTLRLRGISQTLELRDQLLTVDKELLLLAAATRWLARSKSHDLALLVYNEYQALSHRLSDGQTADCLGVLGDLSERDWVDVA